MIFCPSCHIYMNKFGEVMLDVFQEYGPLKTPTSITRSGTTATATITAHGYSNGDQVVVGQTLRRHQADALLLGIEPPQLLVVHPRAFPCQQDAQPPIAKPTAFGRQFPQSRPDRRII